MEVTKGATVGEGTRFTLLIPPTALLTKLIIVLTMLPALIPVTNAPPVWVAMRVPGPGEPPGGPQCAS